MTSQVRNLWCRSQNKMGPSSKYVLAAATSCYETSLAFGEKHLCCAITIQRISTPEVASV